MTQTVAISSARLSLVLALPQRGMPEILAFQPRPAEPAVAIRRAGRLNGMDSDLAPATLLPTGGMGYFGWPAICGHRNGRDFLQQFENWSVEAVGATTTLRGVDERAGLTLQIEFVPDDTGVLRMTTSLTNTGSQPFMLDRCMAATMLVDDPGAEVITFTGAWGREFQQRREPVGSAIWVKENRRGRTSHDRFPGLALVGDSNGGNAAADAFGLHLGWSGNHVMAIDRMDDGRMLAHAGELFEPGEVILAAGETYRSPVAYLSRQRCMADLGDAFHAAVRGGLVRYPASSTEPRPVTLNTWEGNYFDHNLTSLKEQASAAAELGIERFVLDDGWFGRRDSDGSSLGDWLVDARKYPNGLGPLVDHVASLGMEFGIWFEPEMVSPDSDLYRAHPDWVLHVDGRPLLLSRKQLVLDLTRRDVSDHLFDRMSGLLSDYRIACVKWDMNRDLTHAGDANGRAAVSRQTRGVYALMDRIRAAHPKVEIETCASGGGRADYGVLERTHRIWTSDCTDALERLEIQRGARVFFPPEILGAHVSASPNHQTGRRHSLAFRAIVALAYHFGVELNPLTLGAADRAELKDWIALHKRLRPVLHAPGGQFHLGPVDGRYAWGGRVGNSLVLIVAQGAQMMKEPTLLRLPKHVVGQGAWRIIRQHPAEPDYVRVSDDQRRMLSGAVALPSAQLVEFGLPLPKLKPESGIVLELDRVEGA